MRERGSHLSFWTLLAEESAFMTNWNLQLLCDIELSCPVTLNTLLSLLYSTYCTFFIKSATLVRAFFLGSLFSMEFVVKVDP
jgi:hypothetical protein